MGRERDQRPEPVVRPSLLLAILAFVVSWKVTYKDGDGHKNVRHQQEFQTLREARKFKRELPGGVWDVEIRKKRIGRSA